MKLKTRGKLLFLIILSVLVFCIIVNLIIYSKFNSYITDCALKTYSKLTLQIINVKYPGEWRIEDDKLYKGNVLINGDFNIVDQVKVNTDVECTIFINDKRITTTIAKNKARVIGTKANKKVVKKVIYQDSDYIGSVNIVGVQYKTIYVPIKSKDGCTIGMYFVGLKQEFINKAVIDFVYPITACTIVLMVVISVFIILLTMKLVINPLTALKMQDEIFANISHELKTPVNVIFSTNQLMELYLINDSVEDKRNCLMRNNFIIKQNCHRLIKLINNIVDLSKMESGFVKLNLYNQNIVQVVEDIVQSVTEYINGKSISIIFDTNTEEKIIACDSEKIERIILNLISNAIKFTNSDGKIFIDVFDKGNTVEITVRDTGIGIEKKNLNTIFERFHQVDKSLSRNAEGSGIGLTIVKSLVELHKGKIDIESKVGEGTIVKIELPAMITGNEKIIEQINIGYNTDRVNIEFSDIYSI